MNNVISIDDLFQSKKAFEKIDIDSGVSLIHDIKEWTELYRQHLINSGKSKNTIAQYDVTLDALLEYSLKYLSEKPKISLILEDINDFLEWMEEYKISKKYGSIKERISHLVPFLKIDSLSFNNYLELAEKYLEEVDEKIIDEVEYVVFDYHAFLTKEKIDIISQETVRAYIDGRKRLSNITMEQRRIAVVALLRFIDKTTKIKHFEPSFWKIKIYSKVKHNSKLHTGFDKGDDKKIEEYLSDPMRKYSGDLSWKQYCQLRTKTMIVLMKNAGLRASETLTLKYADIMESEDGRTYVLSVIGKGNKAGRVWISKQIFEPYLMLMRQNKKGDFLSSGLNGAPVTRANLYISVKTALGKIKVAKCGLHIFRHHFGSTFAAKKDGNIKKLQQILRHSNIQTTMLYSTVNDEALAESILP
jgi:integrase